MPTDRVLVEIVTAANMTGIREAQAGFLGMSSALTAAIVGLGIAVVAGKSMIDITEKREKAEADLAQAIKATGGNQKEADAFLNAFIDTNRQYFSSQSEIVNGYAALLRSGIPAAEAQKDLNRALDIAAIKGISVADATQLMIAAEHGRTRGLIDLGITTAKYTDAQGNLINQGKDMAKVMQEIDDRTAHGRETLVQTTQATNSLSNDWQDISSTVGPSLVSALDSILRAADFVFHKLKELGENKDWGNAVSAVFGIWQDQITGVINSVKWLIDNLNRVANVFATPGKGGATRAFNPKGYIQSATGFEGTVTGPTLFLAGEAGSPEDVSIRPQGSVGGSGHTINISIGTYVGSADQLSKMLAHELRLTGAFK